MWNFWYHIRQTFRDLFRHRTAALWSLIGLSVGIASGVFVLLYVHYEFSWDRHFEHYERTFRFTSVGTIGNNSFHVALTPFPLADLLREQPEVESATYFEKGARRTVSHDVYRAQEDGFIFTDTAFFKVFRMTFLSGDAEHAFQNPNGIVVTASTAKRYFGRSNPMGKELVRDRRKFEVTGVVQDLPGNTQFKFDFAALHTGILPDSSDRLMRDSWLVASVYHYARLKDGLDLEVFTDSLNQKKDRLAHEQVVQARKFLNSPEETLFIDIVPESIADVHLNSPANMSAEPGVQYSYLVIFVLFSLVILIFTVINFFQLTSRHSLARQSEIAIRRIAGASHFQLFVQFLSESLVYSGVALFLALVIVELLLPMFNALFHLQLALWQANSQLSNIYLLLLLFFISFLAGSFPAFGLLFDKEKKGIKRKRIRNVNGQLVLILELMLLSGSLVVTLGMWWHIRTLQDQEKGYAKERLKVLNVQGVYNKSFLDLKQELLNVPGVEFVSASIARPGGDYLVTSFRFSSEVKNPLAILDNDAVDPDYFETLGLNLRNGCFLKGICQDSLGVVVNETVVNQHELLKPIGEKFEFYTENPSDTLIFSIKGVLRDFESGKPGEPVRPLLIRLLRHNESFSYVWVKTNELFTGVSEASIQEVVMAAFPEESLAWQDFDRMLELDFVDDLRLIRIGAILCIVLLAIAIWGVLSFVANLWEVRLLQFSIKRLQGASVNRLMVEYYIFFFWVLSFSVFGGVVLGVGLLKYWLSDWYGDFVFSAAFFGVCCLFLFLLLSFVAIVAMYYRMNSNRNLSCEEF